MSGRNITYTVTSSTGVSIEIWLENGLFHSRPEGWVGEPQICLGVDLFEVIAELAGLDLELPPEAEEAGRLAQQAQHELG